MKARALVGIVAALLLPRCVYSQGAVITIRPNHPDQLRLSADLYNSKNQLMGSYVIEKRSPSTITLDGVPIERGKIKFRIILMSPSRRSKKRVWWAPSRESEMVEIKLPKNKGCVDFALPFTPHEPLPRALVFRLTVDGETAEEITVSIKK